MSNAAPRKENCCKRMAAKRVKITKRGRKTDHGNDTQVDCGSLWKSEFDIQCSVRLSRNSGRGWRLNSGPVKTLLLVI